MSIVEEFALSRSTTGPVTCVRTRCLKRFTLAELSLLNVVGVIDAEVDPAHCFLTDIAREPNDSGPGGWGHPAAVPRMRCDVDFQRTVPIYPVRIPLPRN